MVPVKLMRLIQKFGLRMSSVMRLGGGRFCDAEIQASSPEKCGPGGDTVCRDFHIRRGGERGGSQPLERGNSGCPHREPCTWRSAVRRCKGTGESNRSSGCALAGSVSRDFARSQVG